MRRALLGIVGSVIACNAITGAGELSASADDDTACPGCRLDASDDGSTTQDGGEDATTDTRIPEQPGGFLDTTFAMGGILETGLLATSSRIAVQPDGKLAVAGGFIADIAVLRILPTGVLDTTFNVDGRARSSPEALAYGFAIAVDSSNRIVVAGNSHEVNDASTDDDAVAVRFTATGAPDSTFGNSGLAAVFGENELAGSILLNATDVFMSGTTNGDYAFWRFDSAGVQVGSRSVLNVPGAISSSAFVNNGAGIVATGPDLGATGSDMHVVRVLTSTRGIDTSFGTMGVATIPVGTVDDEGFALAVQADGKIVVVGETRTNETRIRYRFVVARLEANGALDTTFGTGGKVLLAFDDGVSDIDEGEYRGRDVVIDGAGKIVVVGYAHENVTATGPDRDKVVMARLLPNGAPDPLFGTNGKLVFSNPAFRFAAAGLARQADGKLVVCGSVVGQSRAFVARITP